MRPGLRKHAGSSRPEIRTELRVRPDGQRCASLQTGFVESLVNSLLSKHFAKKQSMQWTPEGAHLLLQVRTRTLNGELAATFRRWYQRSHSSTSSLTIPRSLPDRPRFVMASIPMLLTIVRDTARVGPDTAAELGHGLQELALFRIRVLDVDVNLEVIDDLQGTEEVPRRRSRVGS